MEEQEATVIGLLERPNFECVCSHARGRRHSVGKHEDVHDPSRQGQKTTMKWLLLFFHNLNKDRVDRCVSSLRCARAIHSVLVLFILSALIFSQAVSQLQVEDLLDKNQSRFSAFAAQLNRIEDAVNRTRQPHNAPSARSRQDMHPNTRAL
ncbi:hypothetical protein R3P38DRAFT_888800 [Favolaschia claudopus]|uniref:Uncharacterized protein n=1 Tax=Favolaschia claudopus TaxID=2862362 RepID=A0AAW0BUD7_9AGAR